MIAVCCRSLTLLCFLVAADKAVSAPPERSISTSRQFLVYGRDIRLRGAICDLAERTKRDVLQLIDQRDEWITPIVVNARDSQANLPEAPRAALSFAQTGFGLKLQLDLTVVAQVSEPEVRRELLRAILLEVMYRRELDLPAGTTCIPPPDWLLDGIPPRQAEFDRDRLVRVLGVPVAARKTILLEVFLRQRVARLDGPGRLLHGAYSFALVELLTQCRDGPGRMARFIADLPAATNDPMADLGAHFPELKIPSLAEKAWSLHLARLAADQPARLLSAKESEQKLEMALTLQISGSSPGKECRLDEFPKIIRSASARLALEKCNRDLSVLATRANPIYRPMICEYAKIATVLARGKLKEAAARLARVKAWRKSLVTTMRAIDDYLNWFEATKSAGPSGTFSDYMKAVERAVQPEAKRRDPISVYLDVLEMEFQN